MEKEISKMSKIEKNEVSLSTVDIAQDETSVIDFSE